MRIKMIVTVAFLVIIAGLIAWSVAQPDKMQVIAAYRTGLNGRTNSQIHNVSLAVKSIDGKVLPPGGEFSFNRTVGSWTSDRGYVKAPVSYDGELIPSWGGGVCQASSTLYNAALLAGMDIIERHRHRFPARYAPLGQDAAVAQYDIDLRFKNPYKWPVKIEAEVAGDMVICRILAQHKMDQKITVEREIRQVLQPREVISVRKTGDSDRRVINRGAPGFKVAVYRRITSGSHSSREFVSQDTYPPMNKLVEMR